MSEDNAQFAARQREKRGDPVLAAPEPSLRPSKVCGCCGHEGAMTYGITHDVTGETYLACSKACWRVVVKKYDLDDIS